jgi:hypothetical protein
MEARLVTGKVVLNRCKSERDRVEAGLGTRLESGTEGKRLGREQNGGGQAASNWIAPAT